jgi:hypothetical protein
LYASPLVLPPHRSLYPTQTPHPRIVQARMTIALGYHRRNSNAQNLFSAYYGAVILQTHKK